MYASKHAVTKRRYANEPAITQFHDPLPLRYNQQEPVDASFTSHSSSKGYSSSRDYNRTNQPFNHSPSNDYSPNNNYNRIYNEHERAARLQQQQWRYGESAAQEHDRLSRDIYNRTRREHANPLGRQGVVDERSHLDAGTQIYLAQQGRLARPRSASYSRVHAPQYTGGLKYRARDDSASQSFNHGHAMPNGDWRQENYNRIYDPNMAPIDFGACHEYSRQQPAPLAATVRRVSWEDESERQQSEVSQGHRSQSLARTQVTQHQSYPQDAEGQELQDSRAHSHSQWTRGPNGMAFAGDNEGMAMAM